MNPQLAAHIRNPGGAPKPETSGGCTPGAEASCPMHRPKAVDQPALRLSPKAADPAAAQLRPKAADQQPTHDPGPKRQTRWSCATQAQSNR